MLTEIKNSISAILYERASSPLYGTFSISWLLCNWKILYLTFFVDERILGQNKVEYIVRNYSDWEYLILYPLISTLILLFLMPYAANAVYKVSLKFKKIRTDTKYEIEKTELLSISKGIELRAELKNSETKFEKLLDSKNEEIKLLQSQVKQYESIFKDEKTTNNVGEFNKISTKAKKDEESVSKNIKDFIKLSSKVYIKEMVGVLQRFTLESEIEAEEMTLGIRYAIFHEYIIPTTTSSIYYKVTSKGKEILYYLESIDFEFPPKKDTI